MKKLTFKEHYLNTIKLRKLSENDREVVISYKTTTYCRLPLMLNEGFSKDILSFKPNDTISVKWYITKNGEAQVKNIIVNEEVFSTTWKHNKVDTWLSKNTQLIR